jgi:lysyl-tRNA synthetase class 2
MSELETQIANRKQKRESLEERGIEAFPARAHYDLEPYQVHARYGDQSAEDLEAAAITLRVPGRVRAIRNHGKTSFIDLHDGQTKLQVMVRHPKISEAATLVLDHLDLGDFLGVSGSLIRTRTGELTLILDEVELLAKAVRPLPEKWHGLTDVESRYRRRYLDLLFNEESRRVFEIRAQIVQGMRDFLNRHDFLEVETPMMQAVPGGAVARPFVTHHNALDIDLYLRIAPELYLKRLLVGGMHRVYEINRNFRNEGISTQHNPEFTMLEFYWAYSDYQQLMSFTEEMLVGLASGIVGAEILPWQEETIDLSPPWQRFTIKEAIVQFAGIDADNLDHAADLAPLFRERELSLPAIIKDPSHPVLQAGSRAGFEALGQEVSVPDGWYGRMLMALFESLVEEHLLAPTFITDYPVEVSPFAKRSASDGRFTERFELYMGRMEIANAFSELNDPDIQAERFRAQLAARQLGDDEAHRFDHEYIRALEHGMPPAGGEGIGIDRLTMLFSNSPSIRDVILFPLLRPEGAAGR